MISKLRTLAREKHQELVRFAKFCVVGTIGTIIDFGLLNLLNTPVLFLMAVAMMGYINPWLTLAVLAIYPIVILGVRGFSRRMFDLTQQVQSSLGDISTVAQENFSAIQVIKSYTLEQHETDKMERLSTKYMTKSVKLALTRNILFNVMAALVGLSELVLLAFGGWEIMQGRLTKGELVAFNVYLGMMVWPTMAFGFLLSIWQRGMAAMSRIEEILAEPTEPPVLATVNNKPWQQPDFWQSDIVIRDLTWGYPLVSASPDEQKTRSVLKNISMGIPFYD